MIFLDIDGVLAPIRRWDRYGDLDPACIRVLNDIVARVGADIVVSSTWRYGKTVAELQAMLAAQGFAGRVVDVTPTGAPGSGRGDEIAAWLAEQEVGGYVIIDDHGDVGPLRTHLVLTQPAHGLTEADAPHVIATLVRPITVAIGAVADARRRPRQRVGRYLVVVELLFSCRRAERPDISEPSSLTLTRCFLPLWSVISAT